MKTIYKATTEHYGTRYIESDSDHTIFAPDMAKLVTPSSKKTIEPFVGLYYSQCDWFYVVELKE